MLPDGFGLDIFVKYLHTDPLLGCGGAAFCGLAGAGAVEEAELSGAGLKTALPAQKAALLFGERLWAGSADILSALGGRPLRLRMA